MKKYGINSALIIIGFTTIIVLLLIGIGAKFDWNLLIIVAGVLFVRIFLTFNLVGVGESSIYFYYPINPFKKQKHFALSEIKNVRLINNSVYGGSAKVALTTKDDLEWNIQLICFKKELNSLCADLQAKGIEVNTFFY